MEKIIDFIKSMSWKTWLAFCVLAGACAVASVLFTSCQIVNRASASGYRHTEKTVTHEQIWEVPNQNGGTPTKYTERSIEQQNFQKDK